MKKYKKKTTLKVIYDELKEIYSLHKIQQEALWVCHDEAKDYGHIFAVDEIFNQKFNDTLNKVQCLLKNRSGFNPFRAFKCTLPYYIYPWNRNFEIEVKITQLL